MKKATLLYLIILLPLIYFAVFLHLDSMPFRVYDESYLALHTKEMMETKDYLVCTTLGQPEMVNVKPPFAIWCMTASSRLLGFSELSIRLPNAIAAVLLCLGLFFFMQRYVGAALGGMVAVLLLISSSGYIRLHVVRSGEYDSLLVLFISTYCLSFFALLEAEHSARSRGLWLLFTIAVVLGIWTKGVAALVVMPGLLLWAIYQRRLGWLMRRPETYISALSSIILGLGYYLLRESYNPGYLQAVYDHELGGRYLEVNEGHTDGFWFYFSVIYYQHFYFAISFLLIGIFAAIFSPVRSRQDRLVLFCTIVSLSFLLIISISATKLDWYSAPAMPLLAMIAASGFCWLIDRLELLSAQQSPVWKYIVVAVFLLLSIAPVYLLNLSTNLDAYNQETPLTQMYIKLRDEQHVNMDGYKVIKDPFSVRAQICAIRKMEEKGQKLTLAEPRSLSIGDKVIVQKSEDKSLLIAAYEYRALDRYKDIELWQITARKTQ